MKKPTPVTAAAAVAPAAPAPMPSSGGSYIRLADGSLQLEEATDNRPEARLEGGVEDPVQGPAPILKPETEA